MRIQRQLLYLILLCFLVLTLVPGCSSESQSGSAFVGISAQALSSQDVARVAVSVNGPNLSTKIAQDLVKVNGQWQGLIGQIPAGSGVNFVANAFDITGALVYRGKAINITITAGANPSVVTILLQQTTPPIPFQNAIPTINFLTATKANVANSESIQLLAGASDVDGDPLTYTWSAPQGSFSSGSTGPNVTWISPALPFAGHVTITLTVSDGRGGQTGTSLTFDVQPHHAMGQAQVSVSFNTWPLVTQMTSSTDPVNVTQLTTLNVSANDPDGDPVTYAWTALGSGCQSGSFSNANIANPVWTAPTTAPLSGTCALRVSINDNRGGQTNGTLTLHVGAPPPPNFPPIFLNTFQSSTISNIGTTVTFRVFARDPEGTPLAFTWSDSNGGLGTGISNSGNGPYQSELVWTQPSSPCPQSITVNAIDATGQSSSYTFQINQGVVNCGTPPGPYTTQLALGGSHTCALQSDGTVKCAGSDTVGQLGNGNLPPFNQSTTPISVPGLANITQLSSTANHTCALNTGGTVQCWGNNYDGQLGTSSPQTHDSPFTIPGLANVTQVSSSYSHNCALLANQTVQCWGNNDSGKIDINYTATSLLPPTAISGLANVTQISTGGGFTCALLANQSIKCWGFNVKGQLGDGTNTNAATPVLVSGITNATQISIGANHACALLSTGAAKCWGHNASGQLGNGSTTDSSVPVAVTGISTATLIRSSADYSCALLAGGSVHCWGFNLQGQLGNGNTTNQLVPGIVLGLNNPTDIHVGGGFTCAIQADHSVRCWGRNISGQFGDGSTTSQLTAVGTQF